MLGCPQGAVKKGARLSRAFATSSTEKAKYPLLEGRVFSRIAALCICLVLPRSAAGIFNCLCLALPPLIYKGFF